MRFVRVHMSEPELPLDVYATVVAAIAAGRPRDEVLAAHGLSESAFDAIEESIEAEFSKAIAHTGDNVPPFFHAYEAAMRKAQLAAQQGPPPSLDQFARGIAAMQSGGDPVKSLERAGLSPSDLVRALGHWGEQLAKDPALAARFEAIRSGKKRP